MRTTETELNTIEILKVESEKWYKTKIPYKKSDSTRGSLYLSPQTTGSILRQKYINITDNQLAFDIIAMVTEKKGTKAINMLKELRLTIPGEYDCFNGYCLSSKYQLHFGVALKFHQFNLDKPSFYRRDEIADIHELNLFRKKHLQKTAIEAALKNLTKEQIETCRVNLDEYTRNQIFFEDNYNIKFEDRWLDLPLEYIVYKVVKRNNPAIGYEVPVFANLTIEAADWMFSHEETLYQVRLESIDNMLDLDINAKSDSSFECPSYFEPSKYESNKDSKTVLVETSPDFKIKSLNTGSNMTIFSKKFLMQYKQSSRIREDSMELLPRKELTEKPKNQRVESPRNASVLKSNFKPFQIGSSLSPQKWKKTTGVDSEFTPSIIDCFENIGPKLNVRDFHEVVEEIYGVAKPKPKFTNFIIKGLKEGSVANKPRYSRMSLKKDVILVSDNLKSKRVQTSTHIKSLGTSCNGSNPNLLREWRSRENKHVNSLAKEVSGVQRPLGPIIKSKPRLSADNTLKEYHPMRMYTQDISPSKRTELKISVNLKKNIMNKMIENKGGLSKIYPQRGVENKNSSRIKGQVGTTAASNRIQKSEHTKSFPRVSAFQPSSRTSYYPLQ